MVKIYAIALVNGIVGLLVVILGGVFAENVGYLDRDPGRMIGLHGKLVIGGFVGFGMGGMSAESSPLNFSWPITLLLALLALAASIVWVRYSVSEADH